MKWVVSQPSKFGGLLYFMIGLSFFFKMGNHILRWVIYWVIIYIIFYDGKPYFFCGQTPLRHSQMMPNGSSRDLAVLLGIPCSRTKVLSGTYEILSKLPNVFTCFYSNQSWLLYKTEYFLIFLMFPDHLVQTSRFQYF